jgi:hypothetical protein
MKTSNANAARFCLAALAVITCAATAACTTNVTDDITIVDDAGTAAPTASASASSTSNPTPAPTTTGSGTAAGAPAPSATGSDGGMPPPPPPPPPAPGFTGLFATGVDGNGNLLAVGSTDPHYVLSSSDPSNPGPAAIVIAPDPSGTWTLNSAASQWISVNAQGNAGETAYTYAYTTTFTLTGDPTTASLAGSWACDDSCTVELNGTPVATASYAEPAWLAPQSFTIPAGSPFQSGSNTLTFTVDNSGDWATGLQVFSMTGSATASAGPVGAPYALWLDAAKGVTQSAGGVSAWADQSGQGNDATAIAGQPLPTVVPSAIGGLPAMQFSGGADGFQIADATSLQWGTDDYAVVEVAMYTNPPPGPDPSTWGTLYNKNCLGAPFVGPAMWGIYPQGDPGGNLSTAMTARVENHEIAQVSFATDDGNPHVLAMRRTGTTLDVWADGTDSPAQVPLIDVSQVSCGVGFGTALQGDVAEVIAIHGTVSDATMTALTAGLRAKYGF